jgi:nucleotide-binding universal stress UspA family protein
VLAATDLSDPSSAALRRAGELADIARGRLVVTYVVEDRLPPIIEAHTPEIRELLRSHRDTAARSLESYVAKHLPGRQVETSIREGIVHEEIVRSAVECAADVIVVGMHGHGFLAHALAGSTAERVLHRTPCPVLVVPHDS